MSAGLLCLIGLIFLMGTINVFLLVPGVQGVNQQQEALIHDLLSVHAVHIYSDYWTCDRLTFQSNERIICSVLDESLQTGYNRYPPYQTIVQNDAGAAYVFPAGSSQALALAQKVALSKDQYRRFDFDGFVVYQPI